MVPQRLSPTYRMARIARRWSNRELSKFSALLGGDVVNVSGWEDDDKAGSRYRDYFPLATSYSVTNYGGFRGSASGSDIALDLEKPPPEELVYAFDVVFNHTVLEHVYDVQAAVATLCALSRDLVIVVVPFVQEQHYTESFGDYWRFTPMALDRMFSEHGFTAIHSSWNHHRYAATYIFFIASRNPDNHIALMSAVPGSYARRLLRRHPGAWVGESVRKYVIRRLKSTRRRFAVVESFPRESDLF